MRDKFNNTLSPDSIKLSERGEMRQNQKVASDRDQQMKLDEEKAMVVNQKGMFDEEVNQRQQAKEIEDIKQQLQRRKNLFKKGITGLKAAARLATQPPLEDFDLQPLTQPADQQQPQTSSQPPLLSLSFDLYSLATDPAQPDTSPFVSPLYH